MKTLYIDINNTPIANTPELEVLSIDLKRDFYYSLGESIKGRVRGVSSNIDLIEKYVESGESTKFIEDAFKTTKEILFSDNPEEDVIVSLPQSYLEWLRYNNNDSYRNIYEQLYSGQRSVSVTINMEELYEDAISGTFYRQIRNYLKENADIEEFVFNDCCVNRRSIIVRKLKEHFENIGFIPFEKFETPQTVLAHISCESIEMERSKYQIIAKVKVDGMYRFIDNNGDICTPDLCERVENEYYSCGFNFSNFYKKGKDYFYISSDGVKELGNYSEGVVLNERLIAVKGKVWQILDKDGNVIPLPCQVSRIYGMNNQGSVFCKVVPSGSIFRSSSTYFAFVNIHSETIVKFNYDIYSDDSETEKICNEYLIMSPYDSLVLINTYNEEELGCWYYFKTSVHKCDESLIYELDCHYKNIMVLSDKYVCINGGIFNISNSEILCHISRTPKFDYSGDIIFKKNELGTGLFNIKTGNYISDEKLCYSFDNFYVTSKNRQYYLYRKDDDKALENAIEYILPIKNNKGLYVFLKIDNRLIFRCLGGGGDRVRKVISYSLPHELDKGDHFIYTVNDSVINICLLKKKGEIYSYCLNCNGDVIAKGESGSYSFFAFDENTVHHLVNGDTIEICKRDGSVSLTLPISVKCQVAIPRVNGYYLLSFDSNLYSYKNETLTKIGKINMRTVSKSICFVDNKQRYYETSKGVINSDGEILISKNRLANYSSMRFFANDDIIRDIRCSSDEICYGLELI